jgi:hypothetical protein
LPVRALLPALIHPSAWKGVSNALEPLAPLVQPHPTPSLHQRRLSGSMRALQTMAECCVLGACKPVVSIALQGRKFLNQRREVAGDVPANVLGVLWSHL